MRIGIDLDGCVYDFAGALRSWLTDNGEYDPAELPDPLVWDFPTEQWGMTIAEFEGHCHRAVDAGYLFAIGEPIVGARQALLTLRAEGHTLHIVTNRSYGALSACNTEFWLHHNDIPYDTLTFAADKTIVRTDAFVEDNVDNHLALRAAGVRSFLMQRPWNAHISANSVIDWPHFVMVIHHLVTLGHGQEPTATASVLAEAEALVHGSRGQDYGHPIDDFSRTGRIWGAILGIDDVPPHLVGLCMAGLKISREVNAHKRDNLVDLAGYAETVAMVRAKAKAGVEG